MRLAHIIADDFDLARTLDSGQVFHWEKCGHGFAGTIEARSVYVYQRRNQLFYGGVTGKMIGHYFALDHRLREICRSFPSDAAMCAARDSCQGLRIIRQPLWECLATFITSSMKQVAHIRQMSRTLRTRYGERREICEREVFTFPSADRIAKLAEEDLKACALGYRAKNLLATAQLIASGKADLEKWGDLPDDLLREHLCTLPGVGAKVANCVMLFAYERLRAFPIDVWIERVLKEKYFPRRRVVRTEQLRTFSAKYFGDYGGYAQQYLFHHARKTSATKQRHSSRKSGQPLSAGPN
jgi:N-glycosylase/DNA lyase